MFDVQDVHSRTDLPNDTPQVQTSSQMEPSVTPLWIDVVEERRNDEPEASGGYVALARIVSCAPNSDLDDEDTDIETALEAFVCTNGHELWRRIVVRSFSVHQNKEIHASFRIGNEGSGNKENGLSQSIDLERSMCWASFKARPGHQFLCALTSTNQMHIWDVYPRNSDEESSGSIHLDGDGFAVSLPFEACALRSIGEDSGLLIQRSETQEDAALFDAHNRAWTLLGLGDNDRDEGFILKAPPRAIRLSDVTGNTSANVGVPYSVPSLFSLSHPFDEVLPVSVVTTEGSGFKFFSDPLEQLLFVGSVRWMPEDRSATQKQLICVSYHTRRRRHAIWLLRESPPPKLREPVWKSSRQRRSADHSSNHVDLELFDDSEENPSSMRYDVTTRDEALAHALGIKKTPRKPVEDITSRPIGSANRSINRHKNAQSMAFGSLLSPLPSRVHNTSTVSEVNASGDSSHAHSSFLNAGSPLATHPEKDMECIFEEQGPCCQATEVFLASNIEGSGDTVICLVRPQENGGKTNPNELRMFFVSALTSSEKQPRHLLPPLAVSKSTGLQCISATPIQSSHLSPSFVGGGLSTEIIVLVQHEAFGSQLLLYRADHQIVECAIKSGSSLSLDDHGSLSQFSKYSIGHICHSVRDRLDLFSESGRTAIRGSLSLLMKSDAVCERILRAVDAELCALGCDEDLAKSSLGLRADCVRLEQSLQGEEYCAVATPEGVVSREAVESVLMHVFNTWFFDKNENVEVSPEEDLQDPWRSLLQSKTDYMASPFVDDSSKIDDLQVRGTPPYVQSVRRLEKIGSVLDNCSSLSFVRLSEKLFEALYYAYEESKIWFEPSQRSTMHLAAMVLTDVCLMLKLVNKDANFAGQALDLFLQHFEQDLGPSWLHHRQKLCAQVFETRSKITQPKDIGKLNDPICFMAWASTALSGQVSLSKTSQWDISAVNASCDRIRSTIRILAAGQSNDLHHINTPAISNENLADAIAREGYKSCQVLTDEIHGVLSLPLVHAIHSCRDNAVASRATDKQSEIWKLIGREDLVLSHGKQESLHGEHSDKLIANSQLENDEDGTISLHFSSAKRFPRDNRIREAGRLLQSSRPVRLNVERPVEASDHDYERLKQNQLLLLSRRILALSVGRGMLTAGNLQVVPAEPLPLPELCLVGKVCPTNALLALDTSECPTNMTVWPDFHNGVAAGLRLPVEDSKNIISKITRTWIVYNKPSKDTNALPANANRRAQSTKEHSYGGMLMALGLRGHLSALEMPDIYDYLTQGTVTTTVGVLLGMAANKRGTCDLFISKLLCLHIPSLIPHHFNAIDVSSCVQAAAIIGTGLLYQGSSHRMMSEFLITEIGKRPVGAVSELDRESYSLSCGIALGIVNLCAGSTSSEGQSTRLNASLGDLEIERRLSQYITGGQDNKELRHRCEESNRHLPIASVNNSADKSSCIFEGDSINIDITAPGATIALGLIFMKSGNSVVSSALELPQTHFLLEYVRPDFLALRVLSRSLVLWETIEPTRDWIIAQIPFVVKRSCRLMQSMAGLPNSIIDKGLGSEQFQTEADGKEQKFDRQAMRQSYVYIISGACFSLGVRFAGTGDKRAAGVIMERVLEMKRLRNANDAASTIIRPPIPVLETCLACATISLSLVMAGTGDLEVFKLLRSLRWRCDESVKYGIHQAYGCAIGLLFLGGGKLTLMNTPESVAALITAFYPRYAVTSNDNQYHLQALRHVYILSAVEKELRAVDIDSGKETCVSIKVSNPKEKRPFRLTTPCLLQNSDGLSVNVTVDSDRFFPIDMTFDDLGRWSTLFIKRRHTWLKNDLLASGCKPSVLGKSAISQAVQDSGQLVFAREVCGSQIQFQSLLTASDYCSLVLYECLRMDAIENIPVFISLYMSPADRWTRQLIRVLCEHWMKDNPRISADILALTAEVLA